MTIEATTVSSNDRRAALIGSCMMVMIFSAGASLGGAIMSSIWLRIEYPNYSQPAPVPPEFHKKSFVMTKTTPVDVRLRILPKMDFNRIRENSNVYAFALMEKGRCTIYMPDGMDVILHPNASHSEFVDSYNNDVIIHEVMHCIIGSWHPR